MKVFTQKDAIVPRSHLLIVDLAWLAEGIAPASGRLAPLHQGVVDEGFQHTGIVNINQIKELWTISWKIVTLNYFF